MSIETIKELRKALVRIVDGNALNVDKNCKINRNTVTQEANVSRSTIRIDRMTPDLESLIDDIEKEEKQRQEKIKSKAKRKITQVKKDEVATNEIAYLRNMMIIYEDNYMKLEREMQKNSIFPLTKYN